MKISTLTKTFAQSTISVDSVLSYLRSDPGYYKTACTHNFRDQVFLSQIDGFVVCFRFYILNRYERSRLLFQSIEMLLDIDSEYTHRLLPLVMDSVLEVLYLNEWYELMPRYHLARQRIAKTFCLEEQGELAQLLMQS